jgi:uncharacterized membrane protein
VDPRVLRELKRLAFGVGIKTIGYLLVAVGIFLPLINKKLAYVAVYGGVTLIIAGWVYIYFALRRSARG